MSKILVVSFREKLDSKVQAVLSQEGWEVREVTPGDLSQAGALPVAEVVVLFFGREGVEVGLETLKKIQDRFQEVPVICVTRLNRVDHAVDIMKAGAFDYFQMPANPEQLKHSVSNALRTWQLSRRVKVLETQVGWGGKFDDLVGESAAMQEIFQMIQTVAKSNATVLIMGESGTGKELVARAIHRHSERSKSRFLDINCGAIPKELLENELFGHERGAFTGADRQYIGSCERAHQGTLFLDEISEMDPALQVKLLRVLQERSFTRIGGTEKVSVDIRVIAATNKDLRAEVERGAFREDLFYRLNVVPITIPPLRVRREDIALLAQHFLEKFSEENRRHFKGLAPDAMEALLAYDWPGNVRELENNIERVVVLHDESRVRGHHLPRFITATEKKAAGEAAEWDSDAFQKVLPLRMVEQHAIESAIHRCRGDVVAASRKLGIGQATLYRKIKKYGIALP